MKLLMMKCVVLICILFIAVLSGMQLANDGLKRMKGYNDPTFEQVAQITSTNNGNTEAVLLGKTFTVEEKKKQLEDMKSFNAVSKIGNVMAAVVQKVTRISTDVVVGKIAGVFHEIGK